MEALLALSKTFEVRLRVLAPSSLSNSPLVEVMGSPVSGLCSSPEAISGSCADPCGERSLLSMMDALSHMLLGSLRVGAPGGRRSAWAMNWR